MPPRPSSSHSQQGIPPQTQPQQQPQQLNQVSNQGLPVEGGQMTSPGPGGVPPPGQHMQGYPPHMQHGAYKQHGPYPPQSQYSQQYAPRAQFPGYGPSGNQQQGPPNSPGQYRPIHGNHVGPQGGPQGPQGYPQHGGYPQNIWPPPPPQNNPMQNHIQGKNIGPPHSQSPQPQQQQAPNPQQQQPGQQQPPQGAAGNSPRQLNYLKQHLQHKGGYAQQGSTPPPQGAPHQGYGNGPGMPMGPPMPPSSMGPPGAPSSHMDNASGMSMPPHEGMPNQDNGMPPSLPHQVTSVVTTGPDGAQLDEASQQSTLSNTSIGKFSY